MELWYVRRISVMPTEDTDCWTLFFWYQYYLQNNRVEFKILNKYNLKCRLRPVALVIMLHRYVLC